ncbi:DNA primase [Sphingomonas kaistensis]|uniref:DNA primase n=1 Tax=Sphingomonas kaistensis TaxID=298708 RepID=A0A7X6BHE7_9SPHN|nr:DNA primase [Sphingomonas kaistensis]NJC06021.1 DNA primase [Sphingomonas kaistensis]
MTLSPAFLDELRARVTLSSVIAPHVKLTRAGREWKACCPFHNEKTPSFTVNDEKHFYHCFGCGAHGDAIRFLTDNRGLPFMDAVKELAASAGMEVPAADPRSRERAERQATLHDVMAAAQAWFAEQLDSIEGAEARAYCQRRGIGGGAIKRFGIGFAPDRRQGLRKALAAHTDAKLIEGGLLIQVEEKEPYDRFRGRLMIPIRDARGRVIGFGGRILGAGEPKYLNSPETPLFDKGSSLYNLDRASPASRAAKRLIVVEGYMDVIGLDRGGIAEAVAPNGTALTERQLELLWRLDPSPILCLDGDAAGQKAGVRAATRALPLLGPERTLSFVTLPQGQDPDDLVNSGGRDAVEALLRSPEPLVDRLWRHERDSTPLTTPEQRAGLKQRLLDHAAAIPDRSLSQLYRDEWMDRFHALNRRDRPAFTPGGGSQQRRGTWVKGRGFVPPEPPASAEARAIGVSGVDPFTARALAAGLARFPDLVVEEAGILAVLPFADPAAERLKHRLLDQALSGGHLDSAAVAPILADTETDRLLQQALGGFGKGFSFNRIDTEPNQARADLRAVIELLGDRHEIAQGLAEVSARLMDDPQAVAEQHRLLLANQETTKRLADYSASD